jgi:hypothetical protein
MKEECIPIDPPGVELTNVNFTPTKQEIKFKNNRSTNPLPPLVQSNYDFDGNIAISVVFFVDSQRDLKTIQVYWDKNILKPSFYIAYSEMNDFVKTFTSYEIDFVLKKEHLSGMKPDEIQTFVWNKDPITSRGTVTTVRSSTNQGTTMS